MKDEAKTKAQLIKELEETRQRIANSETDHQQSRHTIHKVDARLSAMIKAFDGLIYVCSQDYSIEFMNEHLIKRTGYDGTGELCYKVLHDRDSICPWCVNDRVFRGETVRWEVKSPKDNRWYYIVNAPIYNEDGRISKQAMILDITERKQAEEALRKAHDELEIRVRERTTDLIQANKALRESEERYRYLVKHAPTGIYEIDFATRKFLSVNDAMCQYTGYTREEFLSMDPIQLLTGESKKSFMQRHAKVLAGEPVPDSIEFQVKRKNGSEFWVLLNTRYSYEPNNRILATVIAHDISERKQLEEMLIKSEKQYRNMVDNAPIGVYQVGIDGKFIFANQEYVRIMGYDSIEELRSVNAINLYKNPKNRQIFLDAIKKNGIIKNHEIEIVTKSGISRYVLINGFIEGDHISGTAVDITERKRAEEALHQQSELLRDLSARLSEVEETERKRLARELHDLVGQNLTALCINLSVIRNAIPAVTLQPAYSRLNESLVMVQDTIASIRNVMMKLRPSALDDFGLTAAIRWYGELFSRRTGLTITVHAEEILPRLPARIENNLFRIFQEALTNVLKHANASEVTVSTEEDNSNVRMTIHDNGIGFDTSCGETTPRGKGWGLVMMTERATAAGGSLSIESRSGQGTRITVEVKR